VNHAIVTGATGFVGFHLTQELLSRGVEVTALCRADSPNRSRLPSGVRTVSDLRSLPNADVFFHLAWDGASGHGRGDAVMQTANARFCLEALQAASGCGCAKFVALGTVYERLVPQILASERFGGSDFYVLSKQYASAMADKLAQKIGIGFVCCAVCHPIGRYIKPEQLMAYTVSGLLSGNSPSFGPAATFFDIVAVEDVALGLYLAGERGKRRGYYIGSGAPMRLREYLERTREILGTPTPLLIGEREDDGLRFEPGWFDTSQIAEDTGYVPRASFESAVMNTADWLNGEGRVVIDYGRE